jgi:hypothetical protein
MTPAGEPKLTIPEEVQEVIRGLKVNNAPVSNGIPKRAFKPPIASGRPPCPDFQCRPPRPLLHYSVEARWGNRYT